MAYRVRLTDSARCDFAHLYAETNAAYSDVVSQWYRGLRDAILCPEEQPTRCPATRESGKLRHRPYGNKPHTYRAVFRVLPSQKRVEVLHIRHGAMRSFKLSDVE